MLALLNPTTLLVLLFGPFVLLSSLSLRLLPFAHPPKCSLLIQNLDRFFILDEKVLISSSPIFRVGTQNSIGICVGKGPSALTNRYPL